MSKTIRTLLALSVALLWGVGAVQLASAATVVTIRQADLLPPPISDTRSEGHVTFLVDGLHVQTDDTSSEAKAAEYWQTGGAMPASASMVWFGTDNRPSDPDRVRLRRARTRTATTSISSSASRTSTGPTGGSLRAHRQTQRRSIPRARTTAATARSGLEPSAQWEAAMPNARFLAGGFSLGSGVKGDGVIDSITYGGTEYRFTKNAASGTTTANVTGSYSFKKDGRQVKVFLTSNAQPANTTLGQEADLEDPRSTATSSCGPSRASATTTSSSTRSRTTPVRTTSRSSRTTPW